MLQAPDFINALKARGFGLATGVPCSFLKPFLNYMIESPDIPYTIAASEGEAVAIACGASMTGIRTLVMFQNSGLGNTINPLTSLAYTFELPVLLIATLRGAPDIKDEPQHDLMGQVSQQMLELSGVTMTDFPKEAHQIDTLLDQAVQHMDQSHRSFGFIMHKGDVASYALPEQEAVQKHPRGELLGHFTETTMLRMDALRALRKELNDEVAIVATTGKTGRELYTIADLPNQLYMVGSMGCAPALTLGIKLAQPERQTVVIDGDGACLMKMGTLATIGHYHPKGYLHILIDNNSYESTGGQLTVSETVDFAAVALDCGYARAVRIDTEEELRAHVRAWSPSEGPVLLHVKTLPGSDPDLPRPSVKPPEVQRRFSKFLQTPLSSKT